MDNRTAESARGGNDRTLDSSPGPKGRILVVEDEEGIRTQLRWALATEFDVRVAAGPDEARAALKAQRFEAATLDLGLPPDPGGATEGFRLLEEFLARDPAMKVVVVTGNGDRENAIRAVQLGACDYYLKPIDPQELSGILRRACHISRLDHEAGATSAEESAPEFSEILGTSAAMRGIFDTIRRVARTDATVLIAGESGTGKELIARAIHAKSPRRSGPFIPINCGAIPETLIESELFGHEKGSFTGAYAQRRGRLELAQGGTVFLDEVGELGLPLQVKLLRFLQEREIERVGGRERIPADVRIIAASNLDLRKATQEGTFREDLYYRLAVVEIAVPPLRGRSEDLHLLAETFLARYCREQGKRRRGFSREAIAAIAAHPWPGNVRELENKIKRAVIMSRGRSITSADLGLGGVETGPAQSLREARDHAERSVVGEALRRHGGNITRAAREIGVSRPTLHELIRKHGLDPDTFKGAAGSPERAGMA